MKKLGIVLPTYNRSRYALECVELLLPQLLRNREAVSLLITDNASPDDTEKMLRPFSVQYPELITYIKQAENIGPHANFYYGIKHIDAEYIYLLGDDDKVSPFFAETILLLIHANPKVGMIHFNYLEGAKSLNNIKVHRAEIKSQSLCKHYHSGSEFIKEMLVSPSFISSNVFRKDCMLKGMKENFHEDCYGYDWLVCLYTGVIDTPCLYFEVPLVIQRYGGYYKKFALNTILGQHKVFEYLSDLIPNVLNLWREDVRFQKSWDAISVIKTIPQDKKFYINWYPEIKKGLGNWWQIFNLSIAIHMPELFSKWWFAIVSVVNKIILHKRRKG